MTCTQCETDTGEMDTIVVYGGLIYCDLDCLAEFYVGTGLPAPIETVEDNAVVKEQ